ncbi:MAG: MerR family transcriptional regulator [Acidobacteria bacterium]|nr:MerR family transcriptional regulator [Acidobacteriota bacterium]
MLTVTKLARRCGLSRGTLLYYESVGLLRPAGRSAGNYRRYGEQDLERLRRICAYRGMGLKLADIRAVLDRPDGDASAVLTRRLAELEVEIARLRGHQQSILKLLRNKTEFERNQMITKDKLVSIMRAAGLTEEDMNRFHVEFEKSAPAEHQEFLEFLRIPAEEIATIRQESRKGAAG